MRLCAYWDCMEEVDEGMSFCREHARKLNLQLIDKCPRCGRYKDVRQKLCPDCNYGRPVAGWKISSRNLDEVVEYQEIDKPEEAPREHASPVYSEAEPMKPTVSRGEATCPSCGSPDLTYKKAFDYFRCNNCETTFITPVYSYGETAPAQPRNRPAPPEPKRDPVPPPVRREPERQSPALGQYYYPPAQEPTPPPQPQPPQRQPMPPQQPPAWQEQPPMYQYPPQEQPPVYREQPVRQEQPVYQHQQYVVPEQHTQQWNEPQRSRKPAVPHFNMDFLKHAPKDRSDGYKMQGEGGKLGWVYLLVFVSLISLTAVACWFFFNDQLTELIDTLF